MKKILLPFSFALIVSGSLFWNKSAYTRSSGAPAEHTGAPKLAGGNENTCSECHSVPTINDNPNVSITIQGTDSTFEPGQTYQVTVANTNASQTRGFQLLALKEDKQVAGTFTASTGNRLVSGGGRTYITHSNASNSSWTFSWKAPTDTTQKITFYLASRAGSIYLKTKTLKPRIITRLFRNEIGTFNVKVYPNPTTEYLYLSGKLSSIPQFSATLMSMSGKIILQEEINQAPHSEFTHKLAIPKNVTPGNYILKIQNGFNDASIQRIQVL